MFGPIEVDTSRWPDHLVAIEGDYGVTCRCGAVLAWPGGWNHNETSAARLVAFHAALSSPETTPAGVLDEAWAAAEKALVSRADWWRIRSLVETAFAPMRWEVVATDGNRIVKADGHTPAAALLALAAALGRSGSGGGRG